MIYLQEGDIEIGVPPQFKAKRFDGKDHGLSHCMKAVDFIIESSDTLYFIELKDPDDPKALVHKSFEQALAEVKSVDLARKCRDTFLYLHLLDRLPKPVIYLVVIAAKGLDRAALTTQTDSLKRLLPLLGPRNAPWNQPFVKSCLVLNIESWSKALPQFPIRRLSEAP